MTTRTFHTYGPRVSHAEPAHTYYTDPQVTVGDHVIRIGTANYVVAHINSVKIEQVRVNRLFSGIVGAVLFALFGFVAAWMVIPSSAYTDLTLLTIIGAGGACGFVVGLFAQKRHFAAVVRTSSDDTGAVISSDLPYIEYVQRVITSAVEDYHADRQQPPS